LRSTTPISRACELEIMKTKRIIERRYRIGFRNKMAGKSEV